MILKNSKYVFIINKTYDAYIKKFIISDRLGIQLKLTTRLKACTCVVSHNDFVLEYTFHSR